MPAQSPGENPASCRALANGCARPLKSRYVSRSFSRSRSASIKHTSPAKRSSASFSADPMDRYLFRSSIGEEDSATESRQHRENKFQRDRKCTRLNSSHLVISYAVFCLKKKKKITTKTNK